MFGTLNGLMNYLIKYQQIYQVRHFALSLFIKRKKRKQYIKFPERKGNNNLNSTFINNDSLNGTRNLTQQDVQNPSHFVSEQFVETVPTTEAQRSISIPIQTNFRKSNAKTNNHTFHSKTLCCTKNNHKWITKGSDQ